jgi:protein ImuA
VIGLRIQDLREVLATRQGHVRVVGAVLTGWDPVDAAVGGLVRGGVHEFITSANEIASHEPPLCVLAHLAGCALTGPGYAVWVGRRCWPFGGAVAGGPAGSLLSRSILVDPPDNASRLWAIDLSLRSPAVAVVVADGSDLSMSGTRRLQLAAEAGQGFGLIARPARDAKSLSAATTRWLVRPVLPASLDPDRPRWAVELLRCKGVRPLSAQPSEGWVVEMDREGVVVVSPELVDRPGRAVAEPQHTGRRTA